MRKKQKQKQKEKVKMKKYTLMATILSTLALVQVSSAALVTLYDDDFNDGVLGTNPGIGGGAGALNNPAGSGGSVSESDSQAKIVDPSLSGTQGFISANAFDLSDAALSYTATWNVASYDPSASSIRRLRFNLQSNNDWLFAGDAEESRVTLLIDDGSNTAYFQYQNRSSAANVNYATSNFALGSSFAGDTNGFSVSVVVDSAGYTCTTTGLDADNQVALSGTWADLGAGTTFAEAFQTDGDMYVSSFIQDSGGTGRTLDIDRVTLSSIPEPATLGLVAAFGGGILFVRRRLML
jgi:hypothetical protein